MAPIYMTAVMNSAIASKKSKNSMNYKHQIFYYGPREIDAVAELIKANHNVSGNYKDYPEAKNFAERDYDTPQNHRYPEA